MVVWDGRSMCLGWARKSRGKARIEVGFVTLELRGLTVNRIAQSILVDEKS